MEEMLQKSKQDPTRGGGGRGWRGALQGAQLPSSSLLDPMHGPHWLATHSNTAAFPNSSQEEREVNVTPKPGILFCCCKDAALYYYCCYCCSIPSSLASSAGSPRRHWYADSADNDIHCLRSSLVWAGTEVQRYAQAATVGSLQPAAARTRTGRAVRVTYTHAAQTPHQPSRLCVTLCEIVTRMMLDASEKAVNQSRDGCLVSHYSLLMIIRLTSLATASSTGGGGWGYEAG